MVETIPYGLTMQLYRGLKVDGYLVWFRAGIEEKQMKKTMTIICSYDGLAWDFPLKH